MSQNLLISQNPSASQAGHRSCCLLRQGYVGFRLIRYQCSPWLRLAIALFQLRFAPGADRSHGQIQYFRAIARIDFVRVYGLLNDLLW